MTSLLESILFVASKPLDVKTLAKALDTTAEKIEESLMTLSDMYRNDRGIHLVRTGDTVQLITNPAHTDTVSKFTKSELVGELTPAQLETLTVIAYRGPVSRPELEQIRGVNCAVILRTLLVRGLIEEHEDTEKMITVYELSIDALRFLGISSVADLPEYDTLHAHAHIEQTLSKEDGV